MSDNDDIEVESDEEQPRFQSAADKRAHHNALERKRRDHIKDSFHSLRDSVPSLQGEKSVHWRRRGRVPNCRPTTPPQTTASTPTPRAAPSLPSMEARTPARSRSPKSPKAGRSSGWRPAKLHGAGQQYKLSVSSIIPSFFQFIPRTLTTI
ncbi:protein max isoform X3 [Meles meles]|uniref:protein max isoform X3 n=1 Tax=Meles meles TaxID=9662 RepID=UPI001E69E7EA|nr:protein max isoform X3 [Meles meles]